jgi:Protein of unknown function (DUF2637)
MHPADETAAPQGTTAPADTPATAKPSTDWTTRILLALVMTGALGVGTWSVFTLLTHKLHAPTPLAFFGCGMFDVAALYFARLAQRYATTPDSGLAPRAAMLAMICTSSWVNWQHAALEHWGAVGGVMLGAAPIVAELAFEMWHRYEHREALRALGRVAERLPVLGKWAWLTHGRRSRRVIYAHIRAALTETEAAAQRRERLAIDRARAVAGAPVAPQERLMWRHAEAPQDATNKQIEAPQSAAPERHEPATEGATVAEAARHETPAQGATVAPQTAATERHDMRSQGATEAPQQDTPERHESATAPATKAPRKAPQKRHGKGTRGAAKNAIRALYDEHGRRPLESEMVAALIKAKCPHTSRQFANKLRAEIEKEHPELAALGLDNVRALTGS